MLFEFIIDNFNDVDINIDNILRKLLSRIKNTTIFKYLLNLYPNIIDNNIDLYFELAFKSHSIEYITLLINMYPSYNKYIDNIDLIKSCMNEDIFEFLLNNTTNAYIYDNISTILDKSITLDKYNIFMKIIDEYSNFVVDDKLIQKLIKKLITELDNFDNAITILLNIVNKLPYIKDYINNDDNMLDMMVEIIGSSNNIDSVKELINIFNINSDVIKTITDNGIGYKNIELLNYLFNTYYDIYDESYEPYISKYLKQPCY